MPLIAKKITRDPNKSHLLPDFLWFRLILLNKHMKHDVTNAWLKRHGLRPDNFAAIALEQARATVVATALLKQRVGLVDASQKRVLEHFALKTSTKAGRATITQNQCYQVLNIGKQANRKLFKLHRQLKKQQRPTPQR
jgi:tellurite resistance protein